MNFIRPYSGSKRAITLFWFVLTALFLDLSAQEYVPRSAFRRFPNEMLGDHSFGFGLPEYNTANDGFDDDAEDEDNDDYESSLGGTVGREDAWLSGSTLLEEKDSSPAKSSSKKQTTAVSGTGKQSAKGKSQAVPQKNTKAELPRDPHGTSGELQQTSQQSPLKEEPLMDSPQTPTKEPPLSSQLLLQKNTASESQHALQENSSDSPQDTQLQQTAEQEELISDPVQAQAKRRAETAVAAMRLNRYFFRYLHTAHKGAQFSTGMNGLGYIGYLQLTSALPMPYFELSAYKFGVGLYPLAALQSVFPKKNIPTLFLGAGSLVFGTMLKAALFTGYATRKTGYGGIKFPRNRFITVGTSQKAVQYGVELSGNSWNGAFLASPEPQLQRMRYALQGGWHTEFNQTDIKLAARALTAFVPEILHTAASVPKKSNAARPNIPPATVTQRYHTIAGLQLLFEHPYISADTAGFFTYAANGTASGSGQAECDFWYRLAGLRTGLSYTGENSVNWEGKQQHSRLTSFVQPYMKFGMLSLAGIYTLKKENSEYQHTGGAAIQLKHKIVRWQMGWDYSKAVHTLKTELLCISTPAWFSGVQWFQKAGVGAAAELQNRIINPLVLKRYRISAFAEFCIADGMFIGCNANISQSVRKMGNSAQRITSLQSPVYGGSTFFRVKRDGIGKVHTGKLEVSVKNQKPYFDVRIGYQIQGK